MTQHASLTAERWSRFDVGQQILQIGAEMHRGLGFLRPDRSSFLRACYERVLRLTDLTVQVQERPHLRRELLRWRSVVAGLYLLEAPDAALHSEALRVLLELNPESAKQIRFLGL